MPDIIIREMTPEDEYFVGTCSHVNESEELDDCGRTRMALIKAMMEKGLRVKVALVEGQQAGAIHLMPIEICPWACLGRDLLVIPCLWVPKKFQGQGVGKALVESALSEAANQGTKALVTPGYYWDFWFMPAPFFEKMGFSPIRRRGEEALLWKTFDPSAEPPEFFERKYEFKPVPGKVVVDLFWHFCLTSVMEAARVREVVGEFGDRVLLNEHSADDRDVLLCCQTPRAIFVQGKEISWGYEAPREGIREAITRALEGGQDV
jgi:predicted N-acetyltransferase YhbS